MKENIIQNSYEIFGTVIVFFNKNSTVLWILLTEHHVSVRKINERPGNRKIECNQHIERMNESK